MQDYPHIGEVRMPYDYSRRFLLKHRELVKQLQDLATSRTAAKYSFETWEELRDQQALINNLLASMAKNMPGAEKVRKAIGCWTEWGPSGSSLLLWVGPKDAKPAAGTKRSDAYVPLEYAASIGTGIEKHSAPIRSRDDLQKFFFRVAAAVSHVKQMEFKLEIPGFTKVDGEQFRASLTAMGWAVTEVDDTNVTIVRSQASVVVEAAAPTELDIPTIYANPAANQQWQAFVKYLGTLPPSTTQIEVPTNIEAEDQEAYEPLNEYLFRNALWEIVGGHDTTFIISRL